MPSPAGRITGKITVIYWLVWHSLTKTLTGKKLPFGVFFCHTHSEVTASWRAALLLKGCIWQIFVPTHVSHSCPCLFHLMTLVYILPQHWDELHLYLLILQKLSCIFFVYRFPQIFLGHKEQWKVVSKAPAHPNPKRYMRAEISPPWYSHALQKSSTAGFFPSIEILTRICPSWNSTIQQPICRSLIS